MQSAVNLAITLRMLSGGSYHDLMMLFRIGRFTAYDILASTTDAVIAELSLPGAAAG